MIKIKKIALMIVLSAGSIILMPQAALATVCPSNGAIDERVASGFQIKFCSGNELTAKIAEYLVGFAGFVAVLFIIFGGYKYMIAGRSGNEKAVESARNTISSAVIGLVIVVFAYTVIRIILRAITDVSK